MQDNNSVSTLLRGVDILYNFLGDPELDLGPADLGLDLERLYVGDPDP